MGKFFHRCSGPDTEILQIPTNSFSYTLDWSTLMPSWIVWMIWWLELDTSTKQWDEISLIVGKIMTARFKKSEHEWSNLYGMRNSGYPQDMTCCLGPKWWWNGKKSLKKISVNLWLHFCSLISAVLFPPRKSQVIPACVNYLSHFSPNLQDYRKLPDKRKTVDCQGIQQTEQKIKLDTELWTLLLTE